VASQEKHLHAGWHGDDAGRGDHHRGSRIQLGMPEVNMWCAQTVNPSTTIASSEKRHHPVAEDRLARLHGDNLG